MNIYFPTQPIWLIVFFVYFKSISEIRKDYGVVKKNLINEGRLIKNFASKIKVSGTPVKKWLKSSATKTKTTENALTYIRITDYMKFEREE